MAFIKATANGRKEYAIAVEEVMFQRSSASELLDDRMQGVSPPLAHVDSLST
jgi:hypothetical protein